MCVRKAPKVRTDSMEYTWYRGDYALITTTPSALNFAESLYRRRIAGGSNMEALCGRRGRGLARPTVRNVFVRALQRIPLCD